MQLRTYVTHDTNTEGDFLVGGLRKGLPPQPLTVARGSGGHGMSSEEHAFPSLFLCLLFQVVSDLWMGISGNHDIPGPRRPGSSKEMSASSRHAGEAHDRPNPSLESPFPESVCPLFEMFGWGMSEITKSRGRVCPGVAQRGPSCCAIPAGHRPSSKAQGLRPRFASGLSDSAKLFEISGPGRRGSSSEVRLIAPCLWHWCSSTSKA